MLGMNSTQAFGGLQRTLLPSLPRLSASRWASLRTSGGRYWLRPWRRVQHCRRVVLRVGLPQFGHRIIGNERAPGHGAGRASDLASEDARSRGQLPGRSLFMLARGSSCSAPTHDAHGANVELSQLFILICIQPYGLYSLVGPCTRADSICP
jgi:hypothetical protein